MDINLSDIVISLSGRDKGSLFMVVAADDEFLMLADGKTRRVERAKRKKRKHALFVCQSDTRAAIKARGGERLSNSELRRAIAEHVKSPGDVQ